MVLALCSMHDASDGLERLRRLRDPGYEVSQRVHAASPTLRRPTGEVLAAAGLADEDWQRRLDVILGHAWYRYSGPSGDAELVAFGIMHHDVEVAVVITGSDLLGTHRLEPVRLCFHESVASDREVRLFNPYIEVESVLALLLLRYGVEQQTRAVAIGVDDDAPTFARHRGLRCRERCPRRVSVRRIGNAIAEDVRPELGEALRI